MTTQDKPLTQQLLERNIELGVRLTTVERDLAVLEAELDLMQAVYDRLREYLTPALMMETGKKRWWRR